MSKLRDRIRRLGQRDASSIGFGRSVAARPAHSLLLLQRIESADAALIDAALKGGVDGFIAEPAALAKQPSGSDIWWGMAPASKQAPSPNGANPDFVLASADAPLSLLADDKLGRVIVIDESWPDATLRALDMLSPDAVYVRLGGDVSLQRLLQLRRIATFAGPILVEVDAAPPPEALILLREAGVAGIVATAAAQGDIATLRERINGLPPRRRKRENGGDAVLPRMAAAADDHDHDEGSLRSALPSVPGGLEDPWE